MSKPDDIPDDVWEAAKMWADFLGSNRKTFQGTFARAIMAERERCVAFADAVANDDGDRSARGFLTTEEQARRGAGRAIAAAIRKGE